MQIAGKMALVTGGTDGIGLEIARQLKAKGAHVIVAARRRDLLDAAAGEGLEPVQADLSTADGVDMLSAAMNTRPLDLLVNNAGVGVSYVIGEPIDPDAVDRCYFVNLNAPVRLITALLPVLRDRRGTIVNVTSGLAIAPRSGSPVYCASKAGLRSFTMAIRAQLKPLGVHVIEALPPVVDTAMTRDRVTGSKMSAASCARAIVAAIESDRDEANVGKTRLLRVVESISPALARKVMLRY